MRRLDIDTKLELLEDFHRFMEGQILSEIEKNKEEANTFLLFRKFLSKNIILYNMQQLEQERNILKDKIAEGELRDKTLGHFIRIRTEVV